MSDKKVIYEVKHLQKSFGKVEVLRDINMKIENGEVCTIIGPSGSGKSTFLRCLNLLETPTGGELWFEGKKVNEKTDVKMLRRDVGMVFQSFNLFPMFSAVENVMYAPVHIKKLPKAEAKEEAMELLSRVGLAELGRGERPPEKERPWPFRRAAAACRYRQSACDEAEDAALR